MKRLFAAALFIAPQLFAGSQVVAAHAALSTSSPFATKIGLDVLQRGGNAADAAVAVAFALGVAEPKSTGIGGGGFLIYFDAARAGVWTLDFRESAPMAAKPVATRDGAASAAIPGFVAGLDALHTRFGTRSWKELVTPAARMAEKELLATLIRIAEKGARDFYDGETSKQLVESARAAGGTIGMRDLREYKPVWRAPIKIAFNGADIYTMPPPSSGGLIIAETLKIAGAMKKRDEHLLAEAERRAFIDADKYAADPAAGRVPLRDLLGDERARLWRASIDSQRATPTAALTEPVTTPAEASHTTHFTIVDAQGDVAAVTTSLSGGSFMTAGGFALNGALADFTGIAASPNGLEAAKRPVAPMAPTLVMRGKKPLLAIGSADGNAIPTTIIQVLLGVLLFRQPLADAIAAPRYHQQARPDEMLYEQALATDSEIAALRKFGHSMSAHEPLGDVHAVMIDGARLIAVADPRHGGAAGGF
jgi:gamma-glutamyltranspeptidase/glutathione hydrolase